jgi:lysophospholipase L1-like esterase
MKMHWIALALAALGLGGVAPAQTAAKTYRCGAKPGDRSTVLTANSLYAPNGAGFDLGMAPEKVDASGCSSSKSFFFSAAVPEGNWRVSVVLGGSEASVTTVRAEARRLMLPWIATGAGKTRALDFIVNVRRPEIAGQTDPDGKPLVVKRKPREINSLDWDDKLTLEFGGDHPSVQSIRIEPADVPTVYLAGDSTMVDQDNEPWAAWGQMLPAFFDSKISIANDAESGETIRSFEGERRFAKIFSTIRKGDYLFIQFAHNDMKKGSGYVPPEMYTQLVDKYVAMARERGANPVLVTSMNRRTFDESGKVTDSLAPYPDTMRAIAKDQHAPLIDLNAMSKTLYESFGPEPAKSLFVYAPPNTYPNQAEALHDDTHFNSYGAYELARCIVLALQQMNSPLVAYLREPKLRFDPAKPDAAAGLKFPQTPFFDLEKPYER